jgi:hypothetical protein
MSIKFKSSDTSLHTPLMFVYTNYKVNLEPLELINKGSSRNGRPPFSCNGLGYDH